MVIIHSAGCHSGLHEKHLIQVQVKFMALPCQKKLVQTSRLLRSENPNNKRATAEILSEKSACL